MAGKKKKKKNSRREDLLLILRLVFCFPLGLYVMWTKSRWPRWVKILASAAVLAVIAIILNPMTDPPARQRGGVVVVGDRLQSDALGPEVPEGHEAVDVYTPRRDTIIVEPTATPQPVVVYCNPGGQYYHNKDCRYVRPTTPSVTLAQAIRAGYKPCEECGAPEAVS